MDQEEKVADEPDFEYIPKCNIDRLVFDKNNQERTPFSVNLCSGHNLNLDRPLLVTLIHRLVLLILVIFCIVFLTLSAGDNRFAFGVLALLSLFRS